MGKPKLEIHKTLLVDSWWYLLQAPAGVLFNLMCALLAKQGPICIVDTVAYGKPLFLCQSGKTMVQQVIFT